MYINTIFNERTPESSNSLINATLQTASCAIRPDVQFHGFPSAFAPFLEKISLSAGDYIHRPEDRVDYIYFPETAVISEFEILKDGRAVGISLHGNKSMIGLLSSFDAHPADGWTQVLLAGSAYKIKSEIFKNIFLYDHALQTLIFEYANTQIRQLTQRIVCSSYHTLEERFCTLLLMLRDHRKTGNLSLTQEQIAYFLGTHRPSVTQIAQGLRARKIISYVRKNLTILDREKLEGLACDCYTGIESWQRSEK